VLHERAQLQIETVSEGVKSLYDMASVNGTNGGVVHSNMAVMMLILRGRTGKHWESDDN